MTTTPEEPDLVAYALDVSLNGPRRVMVNGELDATTPERARRDYGVRPDIIFIRKDGWSLGAPRALEAKARSTWETEWIGVMVGHNVVTYADYMRRPGPATAPPAESTLPTPWAVHCPRHGLKYLTRENYERQMLAADARWYCPECGAVSERDDDIYEKATGES